MTANVQQSNCVHITSFVVSVVHKTDFNNEETPKVYRYKRPRNDHMGYKSNNGDGLIYDNL